MEKQSASLYDIEELRRIEFPLSETTTYLNHASISPIPRRTTKVVQDCVDQMGDNASAFFFTQVIPLFENFMQQVAAFINAPDPLDICPITSTSAGLNAITNAIDWQPGNNIVFCDVEFPSNAFPWLSMEKHGVQCRIVPAQHGTLTVEALDRVVDQNTQLVAVSAIQFFTGARADLTALGAYCRERNILFVVDAIQAIGHMDIDVQAMNIDVLATGGQKSLLALTGAGLLYIRREVSDQMQPTPIGPNATEGWDHWLDYDLTPRTGATRFMSGTPNVPGLFSIGSSIELLNELGRQQIDHHTTDLSAWLMDELVAAGYHIVTPRQDGQYGPIVTFQYSQSVEETAELTMKMAQQKVMVTKHLDALGAPYLRVSTHCYNTKSDVQHFLNVLMERN